MASVTISIISHGHGTLVADLLHDLSRQTLADQFDIILTFNIPETFDLSAFDRLRIRVIHNVGPKGFGANHNTALQDAATEWVLVMNPDIRIDDGTLIETLIARHRREDTGLVAPLIRNSQKEQEDSIRRNVDPFSLVGRMIKRRNAAVDPARDERRFFWVAGMFMALPLSVWREIGGFDERFFLYCEDYDLCARLVLRGYCIELDQAVYAVHDAQRSSRKSIKYLRLHIASLLRVWTSAYFWRIWAADLTRSRHPAGPR